MIQVLKVRAVLGKQKYKRKGGPKAATGNNATSKIQHIPQAKPAVEKTPFVPRVVCKYWESGHCQNVSKRVLYFHVMQVYKSCNNS